MKDDPLPASTLLVLENPDPLLAEWVPIAGLEPRFGFSKSTSYRLVAEELVEARKIGGKTIVNLASVRRFIANQPPPNIKADERSAKLVAGSAHRRGRTDEAA